MKRISLSLIALLLYCIGMQAQHRSEQEAMQIAQEFLQNNQNMTVAKLNMVPQAKVRQQMKRRMAASQDGVGNAQGYYIVNDNANNRFVVVSADERMHTILGYSDNGLFDAETAALGLLDMLAEYDSQHASLETAHELKENTVHRTNVSPIGPLLQSDWGQRSPFNDQCPINVSLPGNQRSVSGCVATAMAQVMNYHKFPEQGQGGTYSYVSKFGTALSMNYDTLQLDWSLIKDSYQNVDRTAEERAEVAKLLLACGISVSMDYGQDEENSSGANPSNLPYALANYFGYNPNILFKMKDYYSEEEWNEMIMRDLQAGHPILYAGRMTGNGGHQFVLDGCDSDGRFHMNYGWNGYSNGFFYLTSSDRFLFHYFQNMVCQIAPDVYGNKEDVFYANSFSTNRRNIPLGETARFSFHPNCYSSEATYREPGTATFEGELGVGLYTVDFNYITSLYQEHVAEWSVQDDKYIYADVVLEGENFKDGEKYIIAPYAKSVNSTTPTRIRTTRGEQDYYQAIVEDGVVRLLLKGQDFAEVLTGRYKASATNMNGETEEWYVNLRQWSSNSDLSYELIGIDPVAGKLSTSSYNRNYSFGDVNADGTQISLYLRSLGDNIQLVNYSGNKGIVLRLDNKNGKMYIDDVWGCTKTEGGENAATVTEISRYSNATFTYIEPIDVESPVVEIDANDNIATLSTATPDATIYYTLDGSTPTMSNGMVYSQPIVLTRNCTIKALACKNGYFSETIAYQVDWFTVATPAIALTENSVSIACATEGVTIYYTTDESTPTINSTKYEGPFVCSNTYIMKAFATKEDFNNSQVATKLVMAGEDERNMTITDNVAGELSARIPEANRSELLALTITGQLNGTDIKVIRDLLQNGKIYVLNLKDATIVSGGEKYDGIFSTKDDVIGRNMFEMSKVLRAIELPSGIKSIEHLAFSNCFNLEAIHLPEKVETISDGAFTSSPRLSHIDVAENNHYFHSVDGVLYSKDGKSLVKYPMGKAGLSYVVPEGVEVIANRAFGMAAIQEVALPSTLTQIGNYAFEWCENLTGIEMPNSVTRLGNEALCGCKSLGSVILSSNITEIGTSTFTHCVNLKDVYLGKNVRSISPYAFGHCSSLQEIVVDEDNETFRSEGGVVYTKDMRTLVVFPRGLYAEMFNVPNGVEHIANRAFESCSRVGNVYLPPTLTSIGEYAFADDNITYINIPESVITIGTYAFHNCDFLEAIVFPEGMTRIEDCLAWNGDNLAYVYIPSSIGFIGGYSFKDCRNLNVINSKIKDIEAVEFRTFWGEKVEAFTNIPDTCTWRIPAGPRDDIEKYARKYKEQPWWVETWRIIIDEEVGIESPRNDTFVIEQHDGTHVISAYKDEVINVVGLDGSLYTRIRAKKGCTYQLALPRGIYVVNNKKYVVK